MLIWRGIKRRLFGKHQQPMDEPPVPKPLRAEPKTTLVIKYPPVRRDETHVDDYKSEEDDWVHVKDPYHHLEKDTEETGAFVDGEQMAVTGDPEGEV